MGKHEPRILSFHSRTYCIQVQMAEDKPCQWLCENQTFNAEETKLLHKRITQGYNVHLYVAGYSPLKPDFFTDLCVMVVFNMFGGFLETVRHTWILTCMYVSFFPENLNGFGKILWR